MKAIPLIWPGVLCGLAGILYVTVVLCAEPSGSKTRKSNGHNSASSAAKVDDKDRVSVAVARDRAKVMHEIYVATLDTIHHYYFQRDKSVLPARAMEDIFSEINHKSGAEARWIAVNVRAMSVDHEPESEFEKRAVRDIVAGKSDIEVVEEGYYRRAGAIPLGAGCVNCHRGFGAPPSKTRDFAGLVISVPVTSDPATPK